MMGSTENIYMNKNKNKKKKKKMTTAQECRKQKNWKLEKELSKIKYLFVMELMM
jgi:hypothetical protein